MGSDTQDALPDGRAEWQRAEQAVDRLIAAQRNLMRNDGEPDSKPERVSAPDRPDVAPEPMPSHPRQLSGPRWPTVILLASLWLSIGLVVSAAILSVAMLL